jgi:tetratricopeptide (TPR) repeat protein
VATEQPAAPATAAHADYLAIFLADAKPERKDEEVLQLGERFLRTHRESPLVPEVRMKLGQIYFHRDDFANAETQLGTLAHETPESPYAETALYLAGESAMRQINPAAVDRALTLFDEVVKRGGAFKLHARQQQAIIQSRLGKETEAVTLYDVILAADPPAEPELRFAALAGKGDNLLVLGRKDPAQTSAAIAAFEQLAAQPGVTPSWRNQALYKKAKALEQLRRTPEALTAYYEVLDRSAGSEREYFWYYKAGFDAARLFEQQSQWKSAIGIYEKMAKVDGPRSAEASARVKQLRLEKFLWE